MDWKQKYERAKARLLDDSGICKENRELFSEFLAFEEYKLKRKNGNRSIDDNSSKTLVAYTSRLRVVNRWFQNKPWKQLQKSDIRRVYDDLEDGKIYNRRGEPIRDRQSFYNLILRSKPFELAGKKSLVMEVMQFSSNRPRQEVRFIKEEDFRKLAEVSSKAEHRVFLWLCWDIGENAASILKLRKRDCIRQINEHTREPEYVINLRKEILKRSRRSRSELTNYRETVEYLDQHLARLAEDELLLDFGHGWGKKLLLRTVEKTGVRCLPGGQRVTLKDLRSSMACDLLAKGWSRDEVNARLGHAPSSKEIDRYINYLAIDRVKPKRKLQEHQAGKLMVELAEMGDREKLMLSRFQSLKESSKAQIRHLRNLLDIHSQIAGLTVQYQMGKIDGGHYGRLLLRYHSELVKAGAETDEFELGVDNKSE